MASQLGIRYAIISTVRTYYKLAFSHGKLFPFSYEVCSGEWRNVSNHFSLILFVCMLFILFLWRGYRWNKFKAFKLNFPVLDENNIWFIRLKLIYIVLFMLQELSLVSSPNIDAVLQIAYRFQHRYSNKCLILFLYQYRYICGVLRFHNRSDSRALDYSFRLREFLELIYSFYHSKSGRKKFLSAFVSTDNTMKVHYLVLNDA